MIPRRSSGSWHVRAALALAIAALIGGIAVWLQTPAPSVGAPDGDIRPLFAPATAFSLSAERHRATGSVYDSIEPVAPSAKPVHAIFVYVHGISCHNPDYSAPFQFRLAKALGMTRDAPKDGAATVEIVELTTAGPRSKSVPEYLSTDDFAAWSATATPAQVKAQYLDVLKRKSRPPEFATACSDPETGHMVAPLKFPRLSIRHFSGSQGDRLSVVEVLWSPISERQKLLKVGEDLNLDAERLRANPLWPVDRPAARADVEKRAIANQMLKASVINGAIADAIFYLGDGGPAIRSAVMAGVVRAMGMRKATLASGTHRVSMTMVTESLGSRIAFDTMREAPDRFANELDDTLALLKSYPRVVMFANQLPLLDIAQQPDRLLAESQAFASDVQRQSARARELVLAADQDAGGATYAFNTASDPPSWRACAEAFRYYASAASLLSQTYLGPRITGNSASELADNMQVVLTRPIAPVLALFDDPAGSGALPATLDAAKTFAGEAMAFLAFSPGGLGYANCQRKVATERARVEAFYASRTATGAERESIHRTERLLKIAGDIRAAKIADIDAISNARASMVYGLLYIELAHLTERCGKPGDDPEVCSASAIKARLSRVAAMVPRIEVLAFSDPNDLLSYRVTSEQYESETFAFSNIPVRLAAPLVPAAGAWGGFTPPMEAHTNHKYDNRILAMLVCGWDKGRGRTYEAVNGKPCPLQIVAGPR